VPDSARWPYIGAPELRTCQQGWSQDFQIGEARELRAGGRGAREARVNAAGRTQAPQLADSFMLEVIAGTKAFIFVSE